MTDKKLLQKIINWIKTNPNATTQQFESFLIQRYSQPDLLSRFPLGFGSN
ncbi:MAG: hypothetical protein KAT05_07325 [Spirochaetes bacterium]|nr:hypothetical protein [Spirochaetota bacterium]